MLDMVENCGLNLNMWIFCISKKIYKNELKRSPTSDNAKRPPQDNQTSAEKGKKKKQPSMAENRTGHCTSRIFCLGVTITTTCFFLRRKQPKVLRHLLRLHDVLGTPKQNAFLDLINLKPPQNRPKTWRPSGASWYWHPTVKPFQPVDRNGNLIPTLKLDMIW